MEGRGTRAKREVTELRGWAGWGAYRGTLLRSRQWGKWAVGKAGFWRMLRTQ